MPKSIRSVMGDARRTADSAHATADDVRGAVPELVRLAERVFNDQFGRMRGRTEDAVDQASEQFENARLYVVDRVQERPFTTTLAALGAGVLIGLLFAGGRRR